MIRGEDPSLGSNLYIPGDIVIFKSYTSTSKNLNSEFKELPIVLKIISKTGKILNELSAHPEEDEVLFNKNTKFKILNRVENGEQVFVELEEI